MRYIDVTIKSGVDNLTSGKLRKYWNVIITYDGEQFIKRYYDEGYAKSIFYELSEMLNDNYTE